VYHEGSKRSQREGRGKAQILLYITSRENGWEETKILPLNVNFRI
jgi:hypothetical protein